MAEKKWKFEDFIKFSDLKMLMLDFQMATDISVSLYDDALEVIYGKRPSLKLCSYLVENHAHNLDCCGFLKVSENIKNSECSVVECGMGLSSFIIPITSSQSEPIGYVIGEPVFLSKDAKHDFLDKLSVTGFSKKECSVDRIREYLRDVEVISPEQYRAKANFLLNSINILIKSSMQKDEIEQISMLLAENHILRQKGEEGVNSLLTLFEVSKNINTISDLKTLLASIVNSISKLLSAESCSIMLVNKYSKKLAVAAADHAELTFDPSSETIFEQIVKNGRSLVIKDINSDARISKKCKSFYSNTAALIMVPLRYKQDVIGIVTVSTKSAPSIFAKEDMVLLDSIAEQTAIAITNSNFHAEVTQKFERLTVLNRVSNILNSTLELDRLLLTTIELISEVMGVEVCSLMLLNPENQTLRIVVAHGLDEEIINNTEIKVGEGISGYVARTCKPILIADISKDKRFCKRSKSNVDYRTKSVLSVPLIIKEKLAGVINVNNKASLDIFTADDLQLLETLATQIGSAIENAKLYNQMHQKVVELTMLHNLGTTINSSLDLKNIISHIIVNMQTIFDADMASLMLWDDKREYLRIISHTGLDEQYVNELKFGAGEGVAGAVAASGKPMIVLNTKSETSYKKYDVLHDEVPKTLICAPIIVKKVVEGVICCERWLTRTGPFNEENLNLLATVAFHAAIAIENANLYNDLLRVYLETVQSLAAALDAKDSYTHGHSRRVTSLALALGRELGITENELYILKHAALLHDIGKIGISESILQKPSRLTDDEFDCIKNHPSTGAKILESVEFLKNVCLQIKYHHERFDGKGYPDGVKGRDIPLGSRIIALADTYDAITSTRPYRKGLPHEVALEEVKRCSGSQFDPEVVDAFVRISDMCQKITEDSEDDNVINMSGIKSMLDGFVKPLSLF